MKKVATNAETERRPRRLIDFACNTRCSYRESYRAHLLLAVHPHTSTAAIQSADFTVVLGKEAVIT